MEEYYGNNDWRDYSLQHSWGKKPEQKKREKEYNAWYWKTHKEEIMKKRGSKKRPLARETNVTGKGKGIYRRTGEVDKDTGYSKTEAYNQNIKTFLKLNTQPEDWNDLWVAMYEEGVKLTEDEAKKMYSKFMRDLSSARYKQLNDSSKQKPEKPNRPLAREKKVTGKGKGVHRRTDMIEDRKKTKYRWDEDRQDFVKKN